MNKYIYLQQFCWPSVDLVPEVKLYGRINERAHISLNADGVSFQQNGTLSLNTFFNSLSIGPWKKYCQIEDLYLKLEGWGPFVIRFGLNRLGHAHRWLAERQIELDGTLSIPLDFWPLLEDGMLYCSVTALDEGKITSGGYVTTTAPLHDVKLGIVITHFNRKPYVVPAIKRIQEQLTADERYQSKIDLIVIDNSQNITEDESHGATIIPNLNLGGSGGFTRGLLYLKDHDYTHCLFMDDDASCEIESIRRTYVLMRYSLISNLAVSGSLLREVEPNRMHEKGGRFDGQWRPRKQCLDMNLVKDLLIAEKEDSKTDYGAWWFFAFKIDEVNNFTFPFFVRGDDVFFSFQNNFNICTVNGINCWGEDFWYKENPLTRYLSLRATLLLMFYKDVSYLQSIKFVFKWAFSTCFSYNYSSSQAIRMAFSHFMQGPEFWKNNMDMSIIRPEIISLIPSEKLDKINLSDLNYDTVNKDESRIRKLFRILTLNGFLLPNFCIKNKIVYEQKSFKGWFRVLFRYKKVLYYYEPTGMGYIAEHNKKLFFKELFSFGWQALKFTFKYNSLKKEYQEALPKMTSEKFWREIYNLEEKK